MITCIKCGAENEDEARYCLECGYKLQSERQAGGDDEGWLELEERIRSRFWNEHTVRTVRKDLEAWALALGLLGLAISCIQMQTPWPLYLAIPLVILAAWWRKL